MGKNETLPEEDLCLHHVCSLSEHVTPWTSQPRGFSSGLLPLRSNRPAQGLTVREMLLWMRFALKNAFKILWLMNRVTPESTS